MMQKIEKNLLIVILLGVINIDELKIKQYFNKNGIQVAGNYFKSKKNIDIKDIEKQIDLIVMFQKKIAGLNFDGADRIESKIGKTLEDYKVQIKVLSRDYNELFLKEKKNEVDKYIILEGRKMLKQAEYAVNNISDELYFNIIHRSMNRKEICIGRIDSGNLKYEDKRITVGIVKNIAYNLIEEDFYKYIKRIQKKNIKSDENLLIKNFVYKSHLAYNSIIYLQGLCLYPRDFFKNWQRYRKNRVEKTDEYYMSEFKRIEKYENSKQH